MSARKAAKSELKVRLLTTLKNILEQDKIKLTKKIKKQSKKLVKAVANELVIAKPAVVKTEKAAKANVVPKAVKDVKAKPAPKVADAKAKAATPAKKVTPKATPVKAAPAKAESVKPATVKASTAKPAAKSKTEKK